MRSLNYNSRLVDDKGALAKMIFGIKDLVLISVSDIKDCRECKLNKATSDYGKYTISILNDKRSPITGRVDDIFDLALGAHRSIVDFANAQNASTTFVYDRKKKQLLGSVILVSFGEKYSSEVCFSENREKKLNYLLKKK